MTRKLIIALATAGLVACGSSQKKSSPGSMPAEQPQAQPKEAASKMLAWKLPKEGDGVKQDQRQVTVSEKWLADRLARPTHSAISATAHERGARLTAVPGGTALHGLGFENNDVIVSVDGNQPTPENALAHLLGGLIIDEEVDVKVQRKGAAGWTEGTIELKLTNDGAHGAGFVKKLMAKNTFDVNKVAARLAFGTGGMYTPDTTKLTAGAEGVKLAAVGPKSLLRTLGFESGDLVTEIGGAAPTAPAAGWADQATLTAKVKRGGEDVTLTYNLK